MLIKRTKIGHCKRHEDMNIHIARAAETENKSAGEGDGELDMEIDYGNCALLQGRAKSARRKRAQKIYGCRHCLCGKEKGGREPRVDLGLGLGPKNGWTSTDTGPGRTKESGGGETLGEVTKKAGGSRLLRSFDGLRSHLKAW